MPLDTYTELEDILCLQLTHVDVDSDVLVEKFLDKKRQRKISSKMVHYLETKETTDSDQFVANLTKYVVICPVLITYYKIAGPQQQQPVNISQLKVLQLKQKELLTSVTVSMSNFSRHYK